MDARTAVVLAELERRFAEPWTVTRLAQLIGLSAARFAHLFRADTGTTPMRYLRRLRMTQASVLLTRTSMPVEAILRRVGYRDRRHFRRDFMKHYGVTPGEWRRPGSPRRDRDQRDAAAVP